MRATSQPLSAMLYQIQLATQAISAETLVPHWVSYVVRAARARGVEC